MTREVKTVASQAFQIWMNEDLDSLGWAGPPYITGAFAKPFDTWCDMAHVVPEESWAAPPRTAVYFCAALLDPPAPPADDDADYPARRNDEVRRRAMDFLQGPVRAVWPGAYTPEGEFRWELLVSPSGDGATGEEGPERFATQYWRANVNPSDRYVLHTPGSFRYRTLPAGPDLRQHDHRGRLDRQRIFLGVCRGRGHVWSSRGERSERLSPTCGHHRL